MHSEITKAVATATAKPTLLKALKQTSHLQL
jgi:hypothetical protein